MNNRQVSNFEFILTLEELTSLEFDNKLISKAAMRGVKDEIDGRYKVRLMLAYPAHSQTPLMLYTSGLGKFVPEQASSEQKVGAM
jgi:hypothetical protein